MKNTIGRDLVANEVKLFSKLQHPRLWQGVLRGILTFYLLSASAPSFPSTYALPFPPRRALLAPIYSDNVTESGEIFLCQPCLSLDLEGRPLARLLISGNLGDLPGGVPYYNYRPAAARSTATSADNARRRGHQSLEGGGVGWVLLSWNCSVSSDTKMVTRLSPTFRIDANASPMTVLAIKPLTVHLKALHLWIRDDTFSAML